MTLRELLTEADAWRDQWVGVERNPDPDEAAEWLAHGARLVPHLVHALRLSHPGFEDEGVTAAETDDWVIARVADHEPIARFADVNDAIGVLSDYQPVGAFYVTYQPSTATATV